MVHPSIGQIRDNPPKQLSRLFVYCVLYWVSNPTSHRGPVDLYYITLHKKVKDIKYP